MEANGSSFAELALREHLFGAERHTPGPELRAALLELQSGRCLYSGERVTARSSHLDHVMPWARTRLSALGNFALVDARLNGAKSDALLATEPLRLWLKHITVNESSLTQIGVAQRWPTDIPRVLTVAQALYRAARPGTATWSPAGLEPLTVEARNTSLELLAHAGAA
jgi:hypothetical protein